MSRKRSRPIIPLQVVQNFCPACGEELPEHARVCKACGSLVSATGTCISCGSMMPRDAEKCGKCGSYQDWRRWFAVSSTVLAVATALVSVIGLTINTAATVATPRSSTTASIVGATQEFLLVALINSGNAASVTRSFTVTVDNDILQFGPLSAKEDDTKNQFLKSRDSAVIHLVPGSIHYDHKEKGEQFWAAYGKTPIHLSAEVVESDGEKKTLRDEATLDDIRLLVMEQCTDCKAPRPSQH